LAVRRSALGGRAPGEGFAGHRPRPAPTAAPGSDWRSSKPWLTRTASASAPPAPDRVRAQPSPPSCPRPPCRQAPLPHADDDAACPYERVGPTWRVRWVFGGRFRFGGKGSQPACAQAQGVADHADRGQGHGGGGDDR
jgi:hypothetical protein